MAPVDPSKFTAVPQHKVNILEAYDHDDESLPDFLKNAKNEGE
jgi:hypothetical protein